MLVLVLVLLLVLCCVVFAGRLGRGRKGVVCGHVQAGSGSFGESFGGPSGGETSRDEGEEGRHCTL